MEVGEDSLNVLLVTNDVFVIRGIKEELVDTLRIKNHIEHCKSLGEAVDRLKNNISQPDIIILDLGLIGITNPRDAFQEIEGTHLNIPIIALTGREEAEHNLAIFVMEAGASDVLVRGQFGRLADAIQFALIRSRIAKDISKKSAGNLRTKEQVISWLAGGYSVEGLEDVGGNNEKH